MVVVLIRIDRELNFEEIQVLLFFDNALCRPDTFFYKMMQIKANSLPKCTTSRLQPLKSFNHSNQLTLCRHQNLLLKYVVSRNNIGKRTSDIIQVVDSSKFSHWLQVSRKTVSVEATKHDLQKYAFTLS